ncbi:MAG: type VI secretion system baseplate subunit TssG [Planctomycetes bacterium]|nr:type VI secretion system baseplate subunit TssG [Planctomycetota bacterium]
MSGRDVRQADFYQLVWLLDQAAQQRGFAPIGGLHPEREALRIRPHLSFGSPRAPVENVDPEFRLPGCPTRQLVEAGFFGLYGVDSPLPRHFTEPMLRDEPGAASVRSLLDVFGHRLYSLLFRAWKKYRLATGDPEWQPRLAALAGLGGGVRAGGIEFDPRRLLRVGGLLTQRPRSAAVLQAVLHDYFAGDVPVRIVQLVPRWLPLPLRARAFLGGSSGSSTGAFSPRRHDAARPRALGVDAVLGDACLDRASNLRVRCGPLCLSSYRAFLPGRPSRIALDAVVRHVAPAHLRHDVELVLQGDQVPPCHLGGQDPPEIGHTAWLPGGVGDRTAVFSAPTSPYLDEDAA